MEKLKVLVSGTTGFLGSSVLERLNSNPLLEGVKLLRKPNEHPTQSSIVYSDPQILKEDFEKFNIKSVIHCAALASPYECEINPDAANAANFLFTKTLAECAREVGAHFIFVSTDLIFDGNNPNPSRFSEEDLPISISEYAKSKRAGEIATLHTSASFCVTRFPLLYGISPNQKTGAFEWIVDKLKTREAITLFEDEFRTPLWIEDARRILIELTISKFSGLIHVAGPDRVSRLQMGEMIAEALNISDPKITSGLRRDFPSVPKRPMDASLRCEKLLKLADQPPVGFKEGLRLWLSK